MVKVNIATPRRRLIMFLLLIARFIRTITAYPYGRHRQLYAVLLLICTVHVASGHAKGKATPAAFSFPGSSKQTPSLSGQLLATYKEIPGAKNDAFQYIFSLSDRSGNQLEQHPFARNIEGAWSPQSERVYLNDFMGSTQIDCLVWKQGDNKLSSLTEILLYDPNSGPIEEAGAKPPETPQNSRFELTCDGWSAEDKISVSVEGYTWAGGQFKYKLLFDPNSKKFSLNWK
jgi:hypothetical protein